MGPYAIGFVPEYCADDGAKGDDEKIFAAEALQKECPIEKKRQIGYIKDCAK